MGTVGSELKAEREKRKIPLAHIAAETRISLRHLESLEEGRYNDMPGGIYNRAFLKAYCEILNLNIPEIMLRYENEIALALEKSAKPRVQVPRRSRSFRISPILIWGPMLAVSVAGLYFSRNWITAIFSPYFSHTPAAPIRYETVGGGSASKPSTTQPPTAEFPAQAVPIESTAASSAQLPPSVPDSPPGSPSADAGNPPVSAFQPSIHKTFRLEIDATEKCWVSIERDGTSVFQKIMEPGETQSFEAAEKFDLVVGNAGGVHLKIDGKPLKPLGKPGSVVKLLIDWRNLQDLLDQTAG